MATTADDAHGNLVSDQSADRHRQCCDHMSHNSTDIIAGVARFSGVNQSAPFRSGQPAQRGWRPATRRDRESASAADELVFNTSRALTRNGRSLHVSRHRSDGTCGKPITDRRTTSLRRGSYQARRREFDQFLDHSAAGAVCHGRRFHQTRRRRRRWPATNVTIFVQTPAFASAFTMPANDMMTITNFITLTNGILHGESRPSPRRCNTMARISSR